MKTIIVKKPETGREHAREEARNIYLILTGLFMGAGFFAPILGMILAIVHSIIGSDVFFNHASTILFVVSIPLLIIGSHFLDVYRNRWKRQRESEIGEKIND